MRWVRSVRAMQRQARAWRGSARRVALVPTMGYLHRGHVSLIERARALVGRDGLVVVSIFVNPIQFGEKEDLLRYPRDLARDGKLCAEAGVDVIFAPTDDEMYPRDAMAGTGSTYVVEERLSRPMEGVSRPSHFRGVTTVVAKLFLLVQPEVAVFGAKDYQQAAVVRRMIRDLNFPVRLVVAPTVRESDGLAMSSRNVRLNAAQRQQAVVLSQVVREVRRMVRKQGEGLPAGRLRSVVRRQVASRPGVRLDYVEFFDPETLDPVRRVRGGTHMALAAWVGAVRLIDNGRL